jgi:hypothetical protein
VGVSVALGEDVGVWVGLGVDEGVGEGVGVAVSVAVDVGVAVGVEVWVLVGVGVAVGAGEGSGQLWVPLRVMLPGVTHTVVTPSQSVMWGQSSPSEAAMVIIRCWIANGVRRIR